MPKSEEELTIEEVARVSRETVAKTQRDLAKLENEQRRRRTPFTSEEIEKYERLITTGDEQTEKVNELLRRLQKK